MAPLEAGELIFDRFKITRTGEELESLALYGEHMVEVGQYLKRKLADRAEKCGKKPGNIANRLIIVKYLIQKYFIFSKFWYEVRKKIAEVLEQEKALGIKRDIAVDDSESLTNDNNEEADSEVSDSYFKTFSC